MDAKRFPNHTQKDSFLKKTNNTGKEYREQYES